MKLIDKATYKRIEGLLFSAYSNVDIQNSIRELDNFFKGTYHHDFLKMYYYNRDKYRNRCPRPRDLLMKLSKELYISPSNLYQIRKEVIYKAAMIFYKNGVI